MTPFFGLRGPKLNHAAIALVVFPTMFTYGWNQSVTGGVLTLESFVTTFPSMDTTNTTGAQKQANSTIQGTVNALYNIGAMFGALSTIYLGDLLGRRRSIFLSSFVVIIGCILMSSSYSLAQFIVARLVVGFGIGGSTATVPVWQSEISRARSRGAEVVSVGIFIGLGITCSLWIDFALYFADPNSVAWRLPLALSIITSLVAMAFVFRFPESPRWLLKKDRVHEARQILAILSDSDPDCEIVAHDVQEIRRSLAVTGGGSILDLLKMGDQRILNRTWLAATIQMLHEMCGVNLITFYATKIFQENLGLNPTTSRILSAAMEICQPLGGLIAMFTIDRFGRRKLMLFASAGLATCMAVLAGTTSRSDDTNALIAAVVFFYLFNLIFPIGFLGVPYLYVTEVAPLPYRAQISGLSTATVWIFSFLVVEITPIGFDRLGYRYYLIYMAINTAAVFIIYFFFPETKGTTLEEMDQVFGESRNIFDPVRVARKLQSEVKSFDVENDNRIKGDFDRDSEDQTKMKNIVND